MKLIDADAINFEDMCDCCPSADCGDCPGPEGFASWLKKQPTAYDPDKIVEQLEELKYKPCADTKNCTDFVTCEQHFMQKAIEIVKSGGAV